MQISSFDVFDTVLTRVVGTPKAFFLLLGKQLAGQSLINCTPEAFVHARTTAEFRAYSNVGEKYSLHQIYTEVAIALRLTDEQREKIMHIECALESELIRPIPIARDLIQTARKQGKRVIFVSDMYLPAEFIKEQLVRHSFWMDGDELYVSYEYGKSKATGELFRELLSREGVSPAKVSHYGNDFRVDVQGAKKVGLQVQHFSQGNLNRYEQKLESHSYATEGLSSAMAGASRLVRLQVPVSSSKEEALRDVAAGVVAPTLVGYVLWILQQAQLMGLKRLYFVSRDGQVLLEIARRLVGKLNFSCELRYIYGSRLSWNLPAVVSLDQQQALEMLKRPSWILDGTSNLSIQDFLARVSIAPQEIRDSLAAVGFKEEDWSRILSPQEVQALHPVLDKREVSELILQKAVQKQQVLMKYLSQEGVLDSIPKGLVDVGWFGSSYDSLAALVNANGSTLDVGLFYGLKSNSKGNQSDSKKGYFFDQRTRTGFKDVLPELGIVPLEMFCSADHGTVLGFMEEGDQVRPVFKEERNQRIIDWGLPLVRKAVYSFTENLLLDPNLVNPWADVREASADVLQSFWLNPSYTEAKAWGDFPWEAGHSENTNSLAQSYSWINVAKSFLTARFAYNQGLWFEGSIAQSSPPVQKGIQGFFRYRRLLLSVKSKVFTSRLKVVKRSLQTP
jgi:FMN phosphatase YigB (HAD superfamily)